MHTLSTMKGACCAVVAALAVQAHGRMAPSICMVDPLPTITAGDVITASIDSPQGRPCQATLIFSDDGFLPVTFDLPPVTCLGYQEATISIPSEVPNGAVSILWECAGNQETSSCTRAVIIGGSGNATADIQQQKGTLACFGPTATVTTLVTSTRSSTTLVISSIDILSGTSIFSTTTSTTVTSPTGSLSLTASQVISPAWEASAASSSVTAAVTTVSSSVTTATAVDPAAQKKSATSSSVTSPGIAGSSSTVTNTASTGTSTAEISVITTMVLQFPTSAECSCSHTLTTTS